ncbi:HlyD family efflux transporter periplasmic adaptor subunit [Brevibacterium luteolum]|uniref:HlyD family efflux transporter periplasmic adaptor subunit n=1 Tax=Brevibacterium luteolum TaxID=199591 RepID=A0A849AU21_9MICO|nr:multidrug efflux pump subunit AcrA (membrane-fusion protein) [Brevibacterium luteolum]NNG80103.1 HlyD family efflux transporter periplasmic adaptor subunit [Brevibacterium luteolum]
MTARKRRAVIVSLIAAGLLASGAGGFAMASRVQDEAPAAVSAAVETETAETTDLTERVEVKGTLGYGPTRELGTGLSGTLTSVADPGDTLRPGDELMRIDDRPVVAMRGKLPAWRDFEMGISKGRDVKQLEENLAELGYFKGKPNQRFDRSTAAAIGRWQKAVGLPRNQKIERGRVVFLPRDARVHKQLVEAGGQTGGSVLELTDATLFATAEVQPKQLDLLQEGQEVTVGLPNGKQTEGVVEKVEPAVEKADSSGEKSVKVPVRVALKDPPSADSYANVPVSVLASRTVAENVLAVPVRALLAEPGGGFTLEVVKDDAVERVPVELGRFADDMVEITGGELAAGDQVAVGE